MMKRILLALDLDQSDTLLVETTLDLAAKFDSLLWIVHIAAPDPDFVGYHTGPTYIRDARAEELREEHRRLQQWSSLARDRGIQAEGLLIQGPTVEMLEAEIEKLGIDLLIMGSHRHGFLYTTLVGHTSVKLMRRQLVPILIVPIPEENEN